MPLSEIVAAMPAASRAEDHKVADRGRLEVVAGQREAAALALLFPEFVFASAGRDAPAAGLAGIAAWQGARAADRAQARAAALGVPYVELGEGVLRAAPGPAVPPLGITARTMTGPGSPADSLSPERLLASRGWETPVLLERARGMTRELVGRRLGGRWWDLDQAALPERDRLALVAFDPQRPDRAVGRTMLEAALASHPARDIVVLDAAGEIGRHAAAAGCTVIVGAIDRWEAIDRAAVAYAAGGETGFLALLADRRVRCFAPAFYTGWGVTEDVPGLPRHAFRRTVEEIFAGACLLATRHLDPFRMRPAACEDILDIIAEWKRVEAAAREVAVLVGMSFWKRGRVADFFRSTAGRPVFRRDAAAAVATARARGGAVAVWASRVPPGLAEAAARDGVRLIRVEDGFIRSVGLGSDFMPAASLAVDRRGMYYDPSTASDLEILLRDSEFEPRLVARAGRLIDALVARGITKYNLGAQPLQLTVPPGRRRILVPGQVEDDLSVRLGGGEVDGNLDLLRRVRAASPDAFILYKPHPDVEAGHRKGAVADDAARRFADVIVRDASTAALLAEIDELHTLTSLAGFEALLRRRRVVVYGRPFYAGWGLTHDVSGIDRGRHLSLEELVAGALILYPRYLDPVTRLPCSPEIVIARLEDPALWRPGPLVLARRLQGMLVRRWQAVSRRAPRLASRPS